MTLIDHGLCPASRRGTPQSHEPDDSTYVDLQGLHGRVHVRVCKNCRALYVPRPLHTPQPKG